MDERTSMKTPQQYFCDWEGDAFGYGYGSGEETVLRALKTFLDVCPLSGSYDYRDLEQTLTAPVAWLLINALAHYDIIEYGTSPRFGWLTETGKALATFTASCTVDDLVQFTAGRDVDYVHCYPDHCNCDDGDCRPANPFWPKRLPHGAPES